MIVLGIDGLDPEVLGRQIRAGKMPNFESLGKTGSFRLLHTSIPPQSPVAWSSFITGMNPGGHGIFDFIHRDPKTLLPAFSISRIEPAGRSMTFGDWVLPLSEEEPVLLRSGKAFWEILDEHGIPATVIRMPVNFPPVRTKARTLAGMGTPDISGTYGIFSFYTDDPLESEGGRSGGHVYRVSIEDGRVSAKLFGPYIRYRKSRPQASIEFTASVDPAEPAARVNLPGRVVALRAGEWSDWIQVRFPLLSGLRSMTGICRFYLKSVRPYFRLYVTPINVDPSQPPFPISTPNNYAHELWRRLGFFYTQGIAEDTKALSNGIFDEAEYLDQARMVLDEQMKLFDLELAGFRSGLLFFYFSSLDQNSHMFWPLIGESSSPDLLEEAGIRDRIAKFFETIDRALGKALSRLDRNTTLLVLSDHGFAPFKRSFNLNAWLLDNGYIHLKSGIERETADVFGGADWSRTRAYGLGLNALYLNVKGRERDGIVEPGAETAALQEEIREKLLAVRDPASGAAPVTRVHKAGEIYSGQHVGSAPDLVIGYNRGYRAGWETVLGRFASRAIEDNIERWSGDHCIDYTMVPGVLLANKGIAAAAPALTDMAPTILGEFGIERPRSMIGNTVFALTPANR